MRGEAARPRRERRREGGPKTPCCVQKTHTKIRAMGKISPLQIPWPHTRFEPGTHKLRVRYTIFCGHLPHVHLYYSEPLLTRYTDGLPRLLVGHVHERALLDALRVQAPI